MDRTRREIFRNTLYLAFNYFTLLFKMLKILSKYKKTVITIGAFLLGFSVSGGLLLYSGKELVNLFVYLALLVVFPAIFAIISFGTFIIFRKDSIKLSMFAGVMYSLGALVSLLLTISTKDIAFGWATTLDISSSNLKQILDSFAIWKSFCASCLPSIDLIELSRYNRLGQAVSKEQIDNALLLGQWWKYLAMAILFYGVLLRALLYILSLLFKSKKQNIEIDSNISSDNFSQIDAKYENKAALESLKNRDFRLVDYMIDSSNLGLKSNPEAKDIVVAVKSWEPPILDFFDYLEELEEENKNSSISILLVGLNGKARQEDIDIWTRKLNELKLNYEVIA